MDALRETMAGELSSSGLCTQSGDESDELRVGALKVDEDVLRPSLGDNSRGTAPSTSSAGAVREVILVDHDDEEAEDTEAIIWAFTGHIWDEDGEEDQNPSAKNKPSEAEQQMYSNMSAAIINTLPGNQRVLELVQGGLLEHRITRLGHVAGLVENLLAEQAVLLRILDWWTVLKRALGDTAGEPPDSERAAVFTKRRRAEREKAKVEFLHDPDVQAAVKKHQENYKESRLGHTLTAVFLAIDEVVERTLMREFQHVNPINVVYPTETIFLDQDQRRIVYNLAEWLLSSALSRVERDPRLGPKFLPFVISHKYDSAKDFRTAHPEEDDLEAVVQERNVQGERKGLIFPSAAMFHFVLSLEVGYRAVMLNPVLLGTYLGDLPQELMRVVSVADPVKAAWARCLRLVRDPSQGDDEAGVEMEGGIDSCNELFDFFIVKWHKCRMFAFTTNLTKARKELKEQKAARALRDQLKANAGQSTKKGQKRKGHATPRTGPTEAQRERARVLAEMIGSDTWRRLGAGDLKEYIRECGGSYPSSYTKVGFQGLLRSLAPGIGMDPEPASGEGVGQGGS